MTSQGIEKTYEVESVFAEFISKNYSFSARVLNTKNECLKFISAKGRPIFVKVFRDGESAFNELKALRFLTNKKSKKLSFCVPVVLDFLKVEKKHIIVSEFVEGETIREILLRDNEDVQEVCRRMVYATAEIHASLSEDLEFSLHGSKGSSFQIEQDVQARLEALISHEGKYVLTESEIKRVLELQSCIFYIISKQAEGFPNDYYKDANPANWILANNSSKLVAVDFEGNRQVPCWVDLINILEYAKDYISTARKEALVKYYIEIREELLPAWQNKINNYDLKTMYYLFGVYRHHEQLLHRARDLTISTSDADKLFHFNGFFYHLDRMKINSDALMTLSTLSFTEKQNLEKDIYETHDIYFKALQRTTS